jgi:hypothetical protein
LCVAQMPRLWAIAEVVHNGTACTYFWRRVASNSRPASGVSLHNAPDQQGYRSLMYRL